VTEEKRAPRGEEKAVESGGESRREGGARSRLMRRIDREKTKARGPREEAAFSL